MAVGRDIIVIGGSAGAVLNIKEIVSELPSDLPASLFVVIHHPADSESMLPEILNHHGGLKAAHYPDGEPIVPGRIYVAPPGHHLLIKPGFIKLTHGPKENGHRPAVDPLFRTAAASYGPRVTGVVLSGARDDGMMGLAQIASEGGATIVLDPREAIAPGMPQNAIEHVKVDEILSASKIAEALVRLATEPLEAAVPGTNGRSDKAELAVGFSAMRPDGTSSGLTCPECDGGLWERREGDATNFICRTGHAFSPESLLAVRSESVEHTLYSALVALREKAEIARRMAKRAEENGRATIAQRYSRRASLADIHSEMLEEMLSSDQLEPDPAAAGQPNVQAANHQRN